MMADDDNPEEFARKRTPTRMWHRRRTRTREPTTPTPTASRAEPAMEIGELLGQGTYGRVFELSSSNSTTLVRPRVLKVNSIADDRNLRVFEREVYYMHRIRHTTPGFCPDIYDWACVRPHSPLVRALHLPTPPPPPETKKHNHAAPRPKPEPEYIGFQVMERMDETMTDRGLRLARNFAVPHNAVVHTWNEISQMVKQPLLLDTMGIIHGDHKRRNMMTNFCNGPRRRSMAIDHPIIIRCIDYGFSGLVPAAHTLERFLMPSPIRSEDAWIAATAAAAATAVATPSRCDVRGDKDAVSCSSTDADRQHQTLLQSVDGFCAPDSLKRTRDLPDEIRKSFWFPDIGFPESLGTCARDLPLWLWPYLNRYQLYFEFVLNRPTYTYISDREVRLLEPFEVSAQLQLSEEVICGFDKMLDYQAIRPWKTLPTRCLRFPTSSRDHHDRERTSSRKSRSMISSMQTEWVHWTPTQMRGPQERISTIAARRLAHDAAETAVPQRRHGGGGGGDARENK